MNQFVYILTFTSYEGESLLGIWENPELAAKELRSIMKKCRKEYSRYEETRKGPHETSVQCYKQLWKDGVDNWSGTYSINAVPLNTRLK